MTTPNGNEPALPRDKTITGNEPGLGGKKRLTFKNIRPMLLERAGNKCEQCDVANGAIGARDRSGEWHDENSIHGMQSDYGYSLFGYEWPDMIKIVLISTRLDTPGKHGDHLIMYCQRCHLNLKREHYMGKARETRRVARVAALHKQAQDIGQSEMDL